MLEALGTQRDQVITGCPCVEHLTNWSDSKCHGTAVWTSGWHTYSMPLSQSSLLQGFWKGNIISRLHDTAGCQAGCTSGLTTGWMFVYTIQPVCQLCWTNSHCSFNHSTGCQTGLYNRFDNRLYTRYSRLSKLSNEFDNRLIVCMHDTTGCQTGLTTGCIV